MSDNGSLPTSVRFKQACRISRHRQAFASYNYPKGNAHTGRVFLTMKEGLILLSEGTNPFELTDQFKN